ncbi:MAG: glycosyltransferase family 9 protein [Bacteroidota bacterium]
MEPKKKFLILRFSSIGDIVLTSPVVRAIKLQIEEAEVHYCTKIQFRTLIENSPYLDKCFYLDKNLNTLIQQLQAEQYDYIIDLHNNLRTRIIKLRLGVKAFSFNKLNYEKWLLVNLKINRMPDVHIVDRYLDTLKTFQVKKDHFGLEYFIPHKDIVEKAWLPETHRKSYVAYAIGGQHNTKKLPLPRMIELCQKINQPIILLGGKEDAEAGKHIEAAFPQESTGDLAHPRSKTVIYNACGLYNLNQSASILKRASVVFSHDTGLMHIAAAFRKPIYAIWGNTTPLLGMYPYQTKFVSLENNQLSCRPCSKIGFKACPKGHFKCMNDIVFDFQLP